MQTDRWEMEKNTVKSDFKKKKCHRLTGKIKLKIVGIRWGCVCEGVLYLCVMPMAGLFDSIEYMAEIKSHISHECVVLI